MPCHTPLYQNMFRRRGMTLIELLVVLAIIAVLIGLGFYMFTAANRYSKNLQKQSDDAIARANVKPEKWPPDPKRASVDSGRQPAMDVRPSTRPTRHKTELDKVREMEALGIGWMPEGPGFHRLSRKAGNEITELASLTDFPGSGFSFHRPRISLNGPSWSPQRALVSIGPILPLFVSVAPAGNSIVWDNYPTTSAFLLHSNPGSTNILYMDFKGYTTAAGNPWNALENGDQPITELPWSIDSDRSTFSDAELAKIIILWRMVSEDYMPFDLDVTTEDPGTARLLQPNSIRAVIGPRPTVSNGAGGWDTAGGIAFIGSFKSGGDPVCWVWNGDSDPNPEAVLDITVSHECGHTFGLTHDADPPLGYYGGHGTGVTSWGPIMGAPFNRSLTQWSKNTYPNADNPQDDVAIIAGITGYRPDDHGDTPSTATALNGVLQKNLTTTYGIIEKEADVDYFKFLADPGPINIQIDPLFIGANVDVQGDLYDSAGTLLTTSNPVGQLDGTLATTLADRGTYFVKVQGAALLPVLPAGYPTYGSIGNYRITGTVTPQTPALDSFKTMSPLRWVYKPSTKTYEGNITILNAKTNPLSGTFTIVLTLPDPSITVVSPAGVASGQTFSIPFTGTLAPGKPLRLTIELANPNRVPLPTGYDSMVTDIKTSTG